MASWRARSPAGDRRGAPRESRRKGGKGGGHCRSLPFTPALGSDRAVTRSRRICRRRRRKRPSVPPPLPPPYPRHAATPVLRPPAPSLPPAWPSSLAAIPRVSAAAVLRFRRSPHCCSEKTGGEMVRRVERGGEMAHPGCCRALGGATPFAAAAGRPTATPSRRTAAGQRRRCCGPPAGARREGGGRPRQPSGHCLGGGAGAGAPSTRRRRRWSWVTAPPLPARQPSSPPLPPLPCPRGIGEPSHVRATSAVAASGTSPYPPRRC